LWRTFPEFWKVEFRESLSKNCEDCIGVLEL